MDDALLAEASGEVDAFGATGPAAAGPMVTTIHGAKGREWAHVIVCFADEGVLPLRARGGHSASLLLEEARLCYVAMTRACKTLAFTIGAQPSRFVRMIPDALVLAEDYSEPPSLRTPASHCSRAGHTVISFAGHGH